MRCCTVGYRYNGRVLPADRTLTVVGEATDAMGKVAIRSGGSKKLWTSTRSREDLVASTRKAITVLLVLAGCSARAAWRC